MTLVYCLKLPGPGWNMALRSRDKITLQSFLTLCWYHLLCTYCRQDKSSIVQTVHTWKHFDLHVWIGMMFFFLITIYVILLWTHFFVFKCVTAANVFWQQQYDVLAHNINLCFTVRYDLWRIKNDTHVSYYAVAFIRSWSGLCKISLFHAVRHGPHHRDDVISQSLERWLDAVTNCYNRDSSGPLIVF